MSYTSEEEIFKIMQNINNSKAAGTGNLSGRFLEGGAEILAKHLNETCNLSITSRSFPNPCKVAKMKPILRKARKLTNCRPITLLQLFLKVLEWFIHDQTNAFLKGNN